MTFGVHQVWECIFTQKLVDKVVTDTVYIKMIFKTITLLLSHNELQHATDTGNLGNTEPDTSKNGNISDENLYKMLIYLVQQLHTH